MTACSACTRRRPAHCRCSTRALTTSPSYNGAYVNSDSLPSLVRTGANSIEATLGYGIDVTKSQVVADPYYTDSVNALGKTIAEAESLGLSVMVRPVLNFLNAAVVAPYSVGEWRQDYQPTNVDAFFASYKQMIIAEAEVAQQNGAQMLSIGAELDQLAGPQYLSYWTDIISSVRAVFSGALTYSATWSTASKVSFWGQLNYEGIDCYVPLSNVQNPTLQDLVNAWLEPATQSTNPDAYAVIGNQSPIAYFENLAAQSGKPLLFTEVGYANDSGAAMDPSLSGNSPDPTLQAALYQAFFQAWALSGSPVLKGAYFWEWDPNGSTSHVGPAIDSFSPQNSPAQDQATAGFATAIQGDAGNNILTAGWGDLYADRRRRRRHLRVPEHLQRRGCGQARHHHRLHAGDRQDRPERESIHTSARATTHSSSSGLRRSTATRASCTRPMTRPTTSRFWKATPTATRWRTSASS